MEYETNISSRISGIAGLLAGVGLLIEGGLWSATNWTPGTFSDPAGALGFLQDHGDTVRAAVFFGMINLVFATIFIVGLADRIRPEAPTRAAATLYLGLIGVATHALVPLGLWLGISSFVALATSDPTVAPGAWGGFAAFINGAGGVGSLFLGLSILAVGLAGLTRSGLPIFLGWVAVIAGTASLLTVITASTPLAAVGQSVYFPSLLLAIVFRIWGGLELWRGETRRLVQAEALT